MAPTTPERKPTSPRDLPYCLLIRLHPLSDLTFSSLPLNSLCLHCAGSFDAPPPRQTCSHLRAFAHCSLDLTVS